MSSRKKKKKRDRKKRGRPPKPGLRPPGFLGDNVVIATPPGERKMSEVLLEFIEPYSGQWTTQEQLEKLLAVALVAWNAALFSGSERDKFLQEMVQTMPPDVRPAMRAIVDEMMQRKLAHFASNRRVIISYEVTPTPSGPHVSVLSTPDPV